jgi:hypothetical protein
MIEHWQKLCSLSSPYLSNVTLKIIFFLGVSPYFSLSCAVVGCLYRRQCYKLSKGVTSIYFCVLWIIAVLTALYINNYINFYFKYVLFANFLMLGIWNFWQQIFNSPVCLCLFMDWEKVLPHWYWSGLYWGSDERYFVLPIPVSIIVLCPLSIVYFVFVQLVEAVHYYPERSGFDSRWCRWNFLMTQSFWPRYGVTVSIFPCYS